MTGFDPSLSPVLTAIPSAENSQPRNVQARAARPKTLALASPSRKEASLESVTKARIAEVHEAFERLPQARPLDVEIRMLKGILPSALVKGEKQEQSLSAANATCTVLFKSVAKLQADQLAQLDNLLKQHLTREVQRSMGSDIRDIGKLAKRVSKQVRKNKAATKSMQAPTPRPTFVDTTLKAAEVAKARFSHASIAGSTSHGTAPMTLKELGQAILEKGWRGNEPLVLYRMPDGKFTSWGNRRLWALRNVVSLDPNGAKMDINVRIVDYKDKAKLKDIRSFKQRLALSIKHESMQQASERTSAVRQRILSPENKFHGKAMEMLLARVYIDAGKIDTAETDQTAAPTTPIDLSDGSIVRFGYDDVIVRSSDGNVSDEDDDVGNVEEVE